MKKQEIELGSKVYKGDVFVSHNILCIKTNNKFIRLYNNQIDFLPKSDTFKNDIYSAYRKK